MRISIPEILQLVNQASPDEQRALLIKHNTPLLQELLRLTFDPAVEFDLPAGNPPFKTNRDIDWSLSDSNLYNEARRLYLVVKNHPRRPAGLKRIQMENIWVQILEGVHCTEADLLCSIKNRSFDALYPRVTEDLVRSVWPELLPAAQPLAEKRGRSRPRKTA